MDTALDLAAWIAARKVRSLTLTCQDGMWHLCVEWLRNGDIILSGASPMSCFEQLGTLGMSPTLSDIVRGEGRGEYGFR